jgi:hypothetical protein
MMAQRREGWTMEWFTDPRQADEQDRAMYRAMTPQDRLDAMLDLMTRWGHVRERAFKRVLEVVECE